jgi:hypothetical protein
VSRVRLRKTIGELTDQVVDDPTVLADHLN